MQVDQLVSYLNTQRQHVMHVYDDHARLGHFGLISFDFQNPLSIEDLEQWYDMFPHVEAHVANEIINWSKAPNFSRNSDSLYHWATSNIP